MLVGYPECGQCSSNTYGSPIQSNQNLSLHTNTDSMQGSHHHYSKLQ